MQLIPAELVFSGKNQWKLQLFCIFNILYALYFVYFALVCFERSGTALVFAALYSGIAVVILLLTNSIMHKMSQRKNEECKWQILISMLIVGALFSEYIVQYLIKPQPSIYAYEQLWMSFEPAEYQDSHQCCGFKTVTCLHVVESELCRATPAGLPCSRPEDTQKYGDCDDQFLQEHDSYFWRIFGLVLYEPMTYIRFVLPFVVYLALAVSLIMQKCQNVDEAVLPVVYTQLKPSYKQ